MPDHRNESRLKVYDQHNSAWKAGHRCLVVTDGCYEWRKGDKQPFAIACSKGALTIMAGLWETWHAPNDETIKSCTVITTNSNEIIAPLHDRMPVVLAESNWAAWLGEVPASASDLTALLRPFPSMDMELWPVDKRVSNVKNEGPELAWPIRLCAGSPRARAPGCDQSRRYTERTGSGGAYSTPLFRHLAVEV
jgi:putative SOS response-associated peptidase YedK